ncbi:hypothetical protein BGY98DRAFT_967296 [Russula aff. rugulosa BPL654]|nr:hypothetical protein BGY98DRAFT_967296 [Russula aff. rugulosa BPL654]
MANGPKVISLEPKPLPVRALWEPPCEDDDREAELRRQQALSAAVDVPSLLRSAQAYISRPQKSEKLIRASALLPSSCPSFFLAEMPRSKPVSLRLSHDHITRPSPHEVKSKEDALPMRRRKTVEKLPAAFWRPLRRWGGKSSGYAMGYEGSWPVEHEHELREKRYVRDTMRKAVHVFPPSI